MWLTTKFFVLLFLFLPTSVLMYDDSRTLTNKEIDRIIPSNFNDSYVYLVMGGYRPDTHNLAKHVVSIRINSPKKFTGDNHFCGGTIISENVVLTAAHCVINKHNVKRNLSNFLVVAGTQYLFLSKITSADFKVKKSIVNPYYKHTHHHKDFALLILDNEFDEDSQSIKRIPIMDVAPKPGSKCIAVGWGRIFPLGPKPDELLYIDLTILKRSECKTKHKSVICAKTKDDDMNYGVFGGDLGGPLICDGKLAGVSSHANTKGVYIHGPIYFSNVYEHKKWILKNVNMQTSKKKN